MSVVLATPTEERFDAKHHVEEELKAFFEAFSLLEAGVLPSEILKKIA